MSAAHRPALAVVGDVEPQDPKAMLQLIVPELEYAERTVAELRRLMVDQARLLSRDRGVAFIREEAIRREFGNG